MDYYLIWMISHCKLGNIRNDCKVKITNENVFAYSTYLGHQFNINQDIDYAMWYKRVLAFYDEGFQLHAPSVCSVMIKLRRILCLFKYIQQSKV